MKVPISTLTTGKFLFVVSVSIYTNRCSSVSLGRGRKGNLSLRHHAQTGPGAHTVSYTMNTGTSFPGVQVAGA